MTTGLPTGLGQAQTSEAGASLDQGSIAKMGHLEVRLAVGDAEIEAAQQLRYRVFYEEMSAVASPDMARVGRDFDDFDDYCDHLLVLDHAARAGEQVVGTYRLLRQEVATAHDGFYTNTEYDIEPLLKRAKPGTQFLELGRSCVQKEYRNRPTVELLWHGIMAYVAFHSMDVMFGCASFTGTDTEQLALPLSFLFHQYLAPEEWRVRALDPIRVEMNRMPKDAINVREAVRSLPPLVKGYVRAGAYIGDGAVVDTQFDTTDVLIVFPVNKMNDRYFSRFGKDERPSNGATNDQ